MHDGILVVNKAQGMTSHDVVELVRHKLGTRQVGHTGTLDPIAEGVLVVLVGRATKFQQAYQRSHKRYQTVIQLGLQTDTGDAWGKALRTAPVPALERAALDSMLASSVGTVTQTPPAFSAVKVRGRPLYWWTRRGQSPPARPRAVTIFSMELLDVDASAGRLTCRIGCSAGTYVRNLAEDIAQRLGTVGHVAALIRETVGPWELRHAVDARRIPDMSPEELLERLQPTEPVHARLPGE